MGAAISLTLPEAYFAIGDDAAKHLAHFFNNSGKRYRIDLEGMVAEVPSARQRYEDEVAQAQEFIELLGPGQHKFTSTGVNVGYNRREEDENWYFAIGGYLSWGRGLAAVKDSPNGRQYEVDFEYRFYDRYNWDRGKGVTILGIGITDDFMGEFHREGLAQEFDCDGSFKRHLSWMQGDEIPRSQL